MAYATQADITDGYGGDLLLIVSDRNGDGEIDATAVARALAAATALIESFLAVRYPTPLTTVPDLVRDMCVDIALYKLAGGGVGPTDEMRLRYEDALSLLKRIADAKANLDILQPAEPAGAGDVLLVAGDRVFTPDSLRHF
ncbi:MAG: DUF1320 domain-containing protein [Magnetospirillum sp.]|nr:MAG: DUF1320 domain-containing protein [Magnetospirillum sp.]